MIFWYFAFGAALVAYGGSAAQAVASVPFYALVEYAIHRWVLHGPWAPDVAWRIHGAHHARPAEAKHIHVPPRLVCGIALVLGLVARGALGYLPAGVLGGALIQFGMFELAHLACHGHGPLAGLIPKSVRSHHAAHHERDDGHAYAVSWPIVDRVIGPWPSSLWSYRVDGIPFAGRVAATSPEAAAKAAASEIRPAPAEQRILVAISPARGGSEIPFAVTTRGSISSTVKRG